MMADRGVAALQRNSTRSVRFCSRVRMVIRSSRRVSTPGKCFTLVVAGQGRHRELAVRLTEWRNGYITTQPIGFKSVPIRLRQGDGAQIYNPAPCSLVRMQSLIERFFALVNSG